jgi:aminopeptidase N
VVPLGRWRRFDAARGALMRAQLERIVASPGVSKDVLEMASRALA